MAEAEGSDAGVVSSKVARGSSASGCQRDTAVDAVFAVFYTEFMPRLVTFLRWQGVPLADAADVAQETMIEAYRQWSTIQHPATWARRVASRLWARRVASLDAEDTTARTAAAGWLLTIDNVAEWEQQHEVLRLIDDLPTRRRQVLAWTLDGYSPQEIAGELGMTAAAVRASLYQARRAIARRLREAKPDD